MSSSQKKRKDTNMKRLLPILSAMLLLASCGGTPAESKPTGLSTEESRVSAEGKGDTTSEPAKSTLTFLENGEIYVDFNFETAPEGLSIKVGETELSASGKAKMAQGFKYEVKGTFANPVYFYVIVDSGDFVATPTSPNTAADKVEAEAKKYLANFASNQYEYRVYFCLTDKTSGWSKTLPGVNETLSRANLG